MKEAGCELVYPLTDLAVVGIFPVLASLQSFIMCWASLGSRSARIGPMPWS
jgi:lipid A disaccharide synthetase